MASLKQMHPQFDRRRNRDVPKADGERRTDRVAARGRTSPWGSIRFWLQGAMLWIVAASFGAAYGLGWLHPAN